MCIKRDKNSECWCKWDGMNDFLTYIKKRDIKYAKTRRRLYKQRHERDRHTKWSREWLVDKLLW